MPPTLQDVARDAGVHPATASRALNPATQGMVSSQTLRRVQASARALKYRGNSAARRLRTRRSEEIGVLVPDLLNPLFAAIARGVESVMTERGYASLIVNTDNDPGQGDRAMKAALDRQVDGLVLAHAFLDDAAIAEALEQGVPLVLVLREVSGVTASTVTVDERHGISLAVGHLVELGHTRIVHAAGPMAISTGRDRLRAFREAMHENGLTTGPDSHLSCESYSVAAGEAAAHQLLELNEVPTGVVAGNDLLALGLISALDRSGLSCPRDISVVGFNDMPLADRFAPPLTTVSVPQHELGAEAARALIRQLESEDRQARRVELIPTLAVRGSSTIPPRRD